MTFGSTDLLRSHYKSSHQQQSSGVQSNPESANSSDAENPSNVDDHQEEVEPAKDDMTCSICSRVFNKDEYLAHFKVTFL